MCVCTAAEQTREGDNVETRDGSNMEQHDSALIEAVVRKYNDALVFGPSEDRMAYTIRDPLMSGWLPSCYVELYIYD